MTASDGTRVGRSLDRGWAQRRRRVGVGERCRRREQRWVDGSKRVERPNAADWALLGAICALAFVTFLYGDVKATFEHSFNFLDSVFAGRPQDFYQIAIENSTFGHPAVYDVPIYAIFGLWNLPTYVLYRFGDFDYLNSTPAQLWLKLMVVVFALVAARLVMAIAKTIGMSAARSKWVAFYFLSSMALFVPVFVIVQYDIISVTFMLAGTARVHEGQDEVLPAVVPGGDHAEALRGCSSSSPWCCCVRSACRERSVQIVGRRARAAAVPPPLPRQRGVRGRPRAASPSRCWTGSASPASNGSPGLIGAAVRRVHGRSGDLRVRQAYRRASANFRRSRSTCRSPRSSCSARSFRSTRTGSPSSRRSRC